MIDGPRLAAASGRAKQLVVFVHGYGADGSDLISIGQEWQECLPDAVFVSPHAPEACAGAPMGRQWFGLTFRDPHERWRGVTQAGPGFDAFLDAELARHGVAPENLMLVGFSQGTMMALHVGLRRRIAPAAILGFSGVLVGPEHLAEDVTSRPPVLLIHGTHDQVVPFDALFMSAEALARADIPVEFHIAHGLGHGIDGPSLIHGAAFLVAASGRVKAGNRLASQD